MYNQTHFFGEVAPMPLQLAAQKELLLPSTGDFQDISESLRDTLMPWLNWVLPGVHSISAVRRLEWGVQSDENRDIHFDARWKQGFKGTVSFYVHPAYAALWPGTVIVPNEYATSNRLQDLDITAADPKMLKQPAPFQAAYFTVGTQLHAAPPIIRGIERIYCVGTFREKDFIPTQAALAQKREELGLVNPYLDVEVVEVG